MSITTNVHFGILVFHQDVASEIGTLIPKGEYQVVFEAHNKLFALKKDDLNVKIQDAHTYEDFLRFVELNTSKLTFTRE